MPYVYQLDQLEKQTNPEQWPLVRHVYMDLTLGIVSNQCIVSSISYFIVYSQDVGECTSISSGKSENKCLSRA